MRCILVLAVLSAMLCACGSSPGETPGPPDTSPPEAPASLSGQTVAPNQVNLVWDVPADDIGIDHYMIFRDGVFITNSLTASFSDSTLVAATEYCYTVIALDAGGNESDTSPQICVTTLDTGWVDITPPSTPLLTVSLESPNVIAVAWANSTDNVKVYLYELYNSSSEGGPYSFLSYMFPAHPRLEYFIVGFPPTQTYCYKCMVRDTSGNTSALSNAACITTPP